MVKFSPVCPPGIYRGLKDHSPEAFGNYFLLLAHDVLDKPVQYHNLFFGIPKEKRTIIMDNSVIELGSSCDAKTLFEACNIVDANYVVIPDVLEQGAETFASMEKFHTDWSKLKRGGIDYDKLFIPQGRNEGDYFACMHAGLQFNSKWGFFDWIGIARNLTGRVFKSRKTPIEHLKRYLAVNDTPKLKVHMMGFSDNVADDFVTCRAHDDIIQGIDSAVPLRLASMGCDIAEHAKLTQIYPDAGKRGNWWETVTMNDLIVNNTITTRKSLGEIV